MTLVRPRLTEYHGIATAQSDLDFAIPFLDEDVPLYVDPFLLWKSPSQQDQALHTSLLSSFNHQNWLMAKGKGQEAHDNLVIASECDEVGLGISAKRRGSRIGQGTAGQILQLSSKISAYEKLGFSHLEEVQLYVDGISKDRISDFSCSFLKSFLIDFTMDQCQRIGIPMQDVVISWLHNYKTQRFDRDVRVKLPAHPATGKAILLVPKRWLRFVPWINFEDYFSAHCPKDDVVNRQGSDDRVSVLTFNRDNYGVVEEYIRAKERSASDCAIDPLFKQIPILSARRKLEELLALPTGKDENADRRYEVLATQLLASLLYPHLDFADTQSRSEGGATIKDLVFYNNRSVDFLSDILKDFGSRQLVFELKNVKAISRDHINQLNRYLSNEFGAFGILFTRNRLPGAMFKNTIELWGGQRRCIICLDDDDLKQMVEVFESRQRSPIEVLKKKYIEFRRACPS